MRNWYLWIYQSKHLTAVRQIYVHLQKKSKKNKNNLFRNKIVGLFYFESENLLLELFFLNCEII